MTTTRRLDLDALAECARPMIFESEAETLAGVDPDDFRYFLGATCFICYWRGHPYVVTANHVIEEFDDRQILVFPHDEAHWSLAFRSFRPNELSDQAYTDIAVLNLLVRDNNRVGLGPVPRVELHGYTAPLPRPDDRFYIVGYPGQKRFADYDHRKLGHQRYRLSARYGGPTGPDHVFRLELDNVADLERLGGLSGSPVFVVRGRAAHFAGMLIWGSSNTAVSKRVHMITGSVVQAALEVVRLKKSQDESLSS